MPGEVARKLLHAVGGLEPATGEEAEHFRCQQEALIDALLARSRQS